MQVEIFGMVAADPVSAELARAGLPYETRVGGELRCRHHPAQAIPAHAMPCRDCYRATRDEDMGSAKEGADHGASV